jgi:Fic family protein
MDRGLTGHYLPSIAGGQHCQAFVPTSLPPKPPLKLSTSLQRKINLAMLELGRLDSICTLLPDESLFLYSYVRKEAVMSSQIEGTQSSLSDLMLYEMAGQPGVPMDDVQEVSCYVNALNLGVKRVDEGHPITFRLVTELHQVLMASGRGINRGPGEFRKNQVWIGGASPEYAVFIPPPATHIAECWSVLEQFINDVPEPTDPLIKAALVHVQFETIHPFMDGNGLLGRLLIPLILLKAKVLNQPLLYLSVFFKKHRQTYYEHLQQVRTKGDWEGWLAFFVDAVATTAAEAVFVTQQLNQLRIRDKKNVLALGRITSSANQVLDAMFETPVANINKLVERTGLTPVTIGRVLDALEVQLGIVKELTGKKRNRIYAYTEYIHILNRDDKNTQEVTGTQEDKNTQEDKSTQEVRNPPGDTNTQEVRGALEGGYHDVDCKIKELIACLEGELSRSEIQSRLNLKDSEHFRQRYILPALKLGFIERTLPDKPSSKLQKYRLAVRGYTFSSRDS